MLLARHLSIRGRVQGVGFRYALQREALRLNLAGWVRNRLDGSVEAVVYGAPDAVDRLTGWARHGPPSARVTDLRVTAHEDAYDGFELRPTC